MDKENAKDSHTEIGNYKSLKCVQPCEHAPKKAKRTRKGTQKKQKAAKKRVNSHKFERNVLKIISKLDVQIAALTLLRQEYIRVHEMEDAVLASANESCESLSVS